MKKIISNRHLRSLLIVLIAFGFVAGIQTGTFASLGQRILGTNRVELDSGLVHHVKFDDPKLLDSKTESLCTTSGNDPAVYAVDRRGYANRAVEFNGIDGSDTFGARCSLSKPANVSVSVWVNLDNWRNSNNDASHIVYPVADGWGITSGSSTWNSWVNTGSPGTRQSLTTSANRTLGEWHHLSMTYDQASGVHKFYVDGVEQGTQTLTPGTPLTYGANDFFDISHNQYNVDGKIDDVRIYNRAINANEVKALYDSYKPEIVVSDLQKGLRTHVKFDGESGDVTPYSQSLNYKNGPYTSVADRMGNANKALDMNGTNQEIELNPYPLFQKFTFSIWVNIDSFNTGPNSGSIILRTFPSSTGSHNIVINDTGELGCSVPSLSNTQALSAAINTGQWYHLACTYDQNNLIMYLNGVAVDTKAIGPGTLNWTSIQITDNNASSRDIYDGKVDDFRVYDRVLSSTEMKQLYEQYDPVVQISDLQKGLMFQAKMDEGLGDDYSPFSVTPNTLQNITATTDRKGKGGGALLFDSDNSIGNASRIRYSLASISHIESNVGNPEITVSAWVNPTNLSADGEPKIIASRNGPWQLTVTSTGGVGSFLVTTSGSSSYNAGAGSVQDGVWQHVAFSYDGTTRRLYYNGVQVGSGDTSLTGSLADSVTPMTIGYDHCCGERRFFGGSIDDVRVYNRALSATEMKALYETN